MQIPLTPPESGAAVLRQREISPVAPVSPVQGVPDEAARVDPGVALQWTQPAFKGDGSAETREGTARQQAALAAQAKGLVPLQGLLTAPPVSTGASRTSSTQPYLPTSTAVASLLGEVAQPHADDQSPRLSWPKPVEGASPRSQQPSASAILRTTPAPSAAAEDSKVAEPAIARQTGGRSDLAEGGAASPKPVATWQGLMQSLQSSDAFAASRLRDLWFGRSAASQQGAIDAATLTRWVEALDAQSEPAKQATRMLLEGQMQWQGQLAPGWTARVQREDAWREHPQHPGQLEKGAMLRLDVTMPRAGRLLITASQWGPEVEVRVQVQPDKKAQDAAQWEQSWPQLVEQLSAQGVRIGGSWSEDAGPAAAS